MIKPPAKEKIEWLVNLGLQEDLGEGDITSNSIILEDNIQEALVITKEPLILCGLGIAKEVFLKLDPNATFIDFSKDGQQIMAGVSIFKIKAKCLALLKGERTALNILQRLSGIATLTKKFVKKAKGITIMDTRKTTPGLRIFEKYAVTCGGGMNHRFGLFDGILIKDNHIKAAGGITQAVKSVRQKLSSRNIEVEASNLNEVKEAVKEDVDIILLDNMSFKNIRKAINLGQSKTKFEISGSVSLENLEEVATTGVDFISVGALTHSVRAVDISMNFCS